MREYMIYLITKDVAQSYYGKENKLFQLFLEEQRTNDIHNQIIKKQISYITEILSIQKMEEHLWEMFKKGYKWSFEGHSYLLEYKNTVSRLVLHEQYIHMYSFGGLEAETVLFEALRKYRPYFLAMDFQKRKYGWLTPFKLNRVYAT